jgi:hypothetical protein
MEIGDPARRVIGSRRVTELVIERILQVLQQLHTIPAAIRPDIEQWARDMSNSKVSQLAERMLVRQH